MTGSALAVRELYLAWAKPFPRGGSVGNIQMIRMCAYSAYPLTRLPAPLNSRGVWVRPSTGPLEVGIHSHPCGGASAPLACTPIVFPWDNFFRPFLGACLYVGTTP